MYYRNYLKILIVFVRNQSSNSTTSFQKGYSKISCISSSISKSYIDARLFRINIYSINYLHDSYLDFICCCRRNSLVWMLYKIIFLTYSWFIGILAHECGHGSFSDNTYANDILGYILHTPLLVPYFSW